MLEDKIIMIEEEEELWNSFVPRNEKVDECIAQFGGVDFSM